MDDRTLTALQASIRHWEENVAAVSPLVASCLAEDCALCMMCERGHSIDCSRGCPVMERTGKGGCHGTPYYDALFALYDWRRQPGDAGSKKAWQAAAQAELDFLRRLLPARATQP